MAKQATLGVFAESLRYAPRRKTTDLGLSADKYIGRWIAPAMRELVCTLYKN